MVSAVDCAGVRVGVAEVLDVAVPEAVAFCPESTAGDDAGAGEGVG
ncbi:hypothetical protein VB773_22235 [Haloarculaceae archaeon H-GB2-1]|nr:hypothetical protein [Haloarculaceae archaeon H-GB11]MEA5410019.1 hypothetical protein [Haloarculaceae archaeon H-GB2-1]